MRMGCTRMSGVGGAGSKRTIRREVKETGGSIGDEPVGIGKIAVPKTMTRSRRSEKAKMEHTISKKTKKKESEER